MPALEVRDLRKRFGVLDVLRGVDLRIESGEIVALVGENGAGKSTVVRCLARTFAADRGAITLDGRPLGADPPAVRSQGLAVVWQDLSLCDNLSAVSNLFLGSERRRSALLDDDEMRREAAALFARLHINLPDLERPAGLLSGGQRQLLAVARALVDPPEVLILDEPTASLGVSETALVERLLSELRSDGLAILLVSHRLEQVFRLADRIAVLRDGRIVADVSPLEVHPDDVAALIAGTPTDSTARRQLRLLQSLVDQLADVEPAASLPMIVSAMAEALAVDQMCMHRLDDADPAVLRRAAAIGLPPAFLAEVETLPIGEDGGPPGMAAATGQPVIVEDARREPQWVRRAGARSVWSVPIVGSLGLLGTITGLSPAAGRPQPDQLELVALYAAHAAAAIDRERLLTDATRRNRVLESLRRILDTLAGPQARGGLALALLALCRGLGADAISLRYGDGGGEADRGGDATDVWVGDVLSPAMKALAAADLTAGAKAVLRPGDRLDRARPVGDSVLAARLAAPRGPAAVVAWWADRSSITNDALDLLDDASRSLRLALEREALEEANAEAESLRRSQGMQREFLSRLNHELRTPLTAIQGYASTLKQTDVSWDQSAQQRFLDSIASESARMGRLVGDLLDFSAIDAGTLRLQPDWCDVGLVLEAARRRAPAVAEGMVRVSDCADLPPIWADHDRLEQVFVNLLENAAVHAGASEVHVEAALDASRDALVITVADDGRGIGPELADRVFLPHQRGRTDGPGAGLGLAIAHGIIEAHGGTIAVEPASPGTRVRISLPVEPSAADEMVPG